MREPVGEILLAFAVLGHDRGGALATKFSFASFFRTVTSSASVFAISFPEAFTFRLEIDQSFERQIKFSQRCQRGRCSFGRLVIRRELEPLRIEQDPQD